MHGFQEGIFNHLTLVVPGKGDRYLRIPFGLHWSEVTASAEHHLDALKRQLERQGEAGYRE